MNEPDAALKASAVGGDRQAAERLFRELYPAVYGFCFSMTRRQADAEDLAQQTFLQAFRHLRRFRATRPIAPWILRIAHNLFVSQLRRRRPQVDLDDPGVGVVASTDPMPDVVAITNDMRVQVQRALHSLASPVRAILVLRYQHQLSYEEIAAVIGKPVTTVTNRLFLAKRQLADRLTTSTEGGTDALQLVGS